uniref:CHY-type domain-containing protein n=1 Tax=Cyprinus carpio carpio TaxID=630221 RepID=A0A9J7XHB7_CYPCA
NQTAGSETGRTNSYCGGQTDLSVPEVQQNLTYGQKWEQNCQHCHTKLNIFVEATRFQFIQPESRNQTGAASQYTRRYRDPAVQQGKPLPDKGACRHFKQSHRWLRFPCCGRAYPCDVCHDEDQDHLMELATRMICGYCAKEQPFSNGKPCVGCGGMMTRAAFTSHWEGGQGCRNKVKMSRNDRQKYANTCKTVAKKKNKEKSN